jgi:hypothetical protein
VKQKQPETFKEAAAAGYKYAVRFKPKETEYNQGTFYRYFCTHIGAINCIIDNPLLADHFLDKIRLPKPEKEKPEKAKNEPGEFIHDECCTCHIGIPPCFYCENLNPDGEENETRTI